MLSKRIEFVLECRVKRQRHDQVEEKGDSDGELLILKKTQEINTVMRTLKVSNFLGASFRGNTNYRLI